MLRDDVIDWPPRFPSTVETRAAEMQRSMPSCRQSNTVESSQPSPLSQMLTLTLRRSCLTLSCKTMNATAVGRTPSGPAQYDTRTGALMIDASHPLAAGIDVLATRTAQSNIALSPVQVSSGYSMRCGAVRPATTNAAQPRFQARGYVDPEPERLTNRLDLSWLRSHDAYLSFEWLLLPMRSTRCKPITSERWRLSALAALLQSTYSLNSASLRARNSSTRTLSKFTIGGPRGHRDGGRLVRDQIRRSLRARL